MQGRHGRLSVLCTVEATEGSALPVQLLIEDTDDQRVKGNLSPMSSMLLQLLHVHEFLHNRGVVLGEVVVLLACLDSSLWAAQLADNVTALEAVLVVLIGDFGFDLIESQEAVQQGQEAGWAVLAALSKHLVHHPPTHQVLCMNGRES